MAEVTELGYNTVIKYSSKTFAGCTSEDLTIAPEMKDSITKADAGTKRKRIVRTPANLTVTGVICVDSTQNDRITVLDLALAKDPISVSYVITQGSTPVTYAGTGYITSYKETTPADGDEDPTYTLEINCPNGLAKQS